MYTSIVMILMVLIGSVASYFLQINARKPDESNDMKNVFRYRKGIPLFLLITSPIWLLVLILVYMAEPGAISSLEKIFATIALINMALTQAVAYFYFKRFYIRVNDEGIEWGGFKARTLAFRDMSKIVLQEIRDGQRLYIYRRDGKKVLNLPNMMQGFDDMVFVISSHSNRYHVPYSVRPYRLI